MLKRILYLLLFCLTFTAYTTQAQNVSVSGALVGNGSYATLGAAFTAINGGAQTGATISISVLANTTEAATAQLNAGAWTSLSITPSGGAWTVGGTIAGPLIELNGADNLTIDGLNSGGNALTFSNASTGSASTTSTFRIANDATSNLITRCSILGAATVGATTNGGTIFFSTGGGTTGNDNNTISFCDIGPVGTNMPTKAIYGNGTTSNATVYNSGNIITNNNIFDCFSLSAASHSIYLNSGNAFWTISNNRFYQTGARVQTSPSLHSSIQIAGTTGTSNEGHLISGNFFGGANSAGTGTLSITGTGSGTRYVAVNITSTGSGTTPNSIQGNTISNIALNGALSGTGGTGAIFLGIFVNSGLANIGTVTGNVVGSTTATNNITVTTNATATGEVYGIYYFPSLSVNISNSQMGGITITNTSTSGTTSFIGIRANTLSGFVNTLTNNTVGYIGAPIVTAITGASTGAGRAIGIYSQGGAPVLTGNTVAFMGSNTGATGTGLTTGVVGILCDNTSQANANVSNNTIHTLANSHTSAAVQVIGLLYNGSSTGPNLIARNNISTLALASSNTTATINGIQVLAGLATYQNNMVRLGYDGSGAAITVGAQITGINETAGTNNFYHNSVYVGGTGVTGAANTFAFSSASTGTRNYLNNIFYNARSNGAGTGKHYGIRVAGTAPNPVGLTTSYNDILANGTGGVLGLYNSIDQATLAAWRTATGQEGNSISYDPGYLNPTGNSLLGDLHIGPAATPIESGGVNIAVVTDDFDGQVRAGLSPVDIGADAGNFLGLDLSGPAISYTPLTFTCATGDRTLTATITDLTGVSTSGALVPRIYFRKNAGAWFSTAGTLASGTSTNGTWNFTISAAAMGGLVATDVVGYYVIAQDLATTPAISANPGAGLVATDVNTVTTPPTTPNTYTINLSLSGTYTVGAAGFFTTLTAAVNAYNSSCLTGPVVFSLTDATYPSETFPIIALANPDASATNTLTIKPATGVTPLITGSNAVAILRLHGADFITIDGSNTVGGTTRDLSIVNTNTGLNSAVIWISSFSAANGANSINVRNCTLRGNAPQTTFGVIVASNGTTIGNIADADMPNLNIENNAINSAFYGIALVGPTTLQTNTVIRGNLIGSTTAANKIGFQALFSAQQSNQLIEDNTIMGVVSATGGSTGALNAAGIAIVGGQSGGSILRNRISDITNPLTAGYGAAGIILSSGSTGINMTIANNFISGVIGDGFNGLDINDNGYGIAINAGTGYRVWHNTVSMNVNQPDVQGLAAALWTSTTLPAASVDLRNNIFASSQTSGAQRYTIAVTGTTNTVFTNINYNDYHTTGANLGIFNGTNQVNLIALTTALGGNANSVSIAPVFVGGADLHLPAASNPLLDNLALPLAGVTTDIDLAVRGPLRVDMGADEFGAVGPEIAVAGNNTLIVDGDVTPSAADFTDFGSIAVCTGSIPRIFTIVNTGNDTLRISSVVVTGAGFSVTTGSANLNIAPFASIPFTVTFDPTVAGLSSGTVTVNSNDADEAVYDFAIQGIGNADVTPPTAICQNVSVALDASGNASVTAAAIDNGSTDVCGITSLSVSPSAFTCANLGPNTVTLTATDAAGNSGTCTATVTVTDNINPTAVCQDITAHLDGSGNATITAAAINNGSTDNCAIASMSVSPSSFTCANIGSNNVTLTVTDAGSNSATCTALVTVADTTRPVAICQAATISLDASGNATVTAAAVNNGSTDNCAITSMSVSPNSFTCANLGTNTVTLMVTDASANGSTCTATVTVVDAIAPTAICQNTTVNLSAGGTASITAASVNNGSTDNCGAPMLSVSPSAFTCANVGANTVTLTVSDASGNSATCTAIVTIVETTAPTAVCQNVTAYIPAGGTVTVAAAALDGGSTDNCAIASVSASPSSFTCADIGPNNVTLTVTDAAGNSATCVAIVTVADTIDPVAICQAASLALDASGNATLAASAVDGGSTDNCAIASISVSPSSFNCTHLGSNSVVLTVTDAGGNSSTCTATVTVVDNIAPTANCQPFSVNLSTGGTASITAANVDAGSTDNCAVSSTSVSPNSFTCANVGPNTVTLTVTDASGNSATCTAIVTVVDNTAPTATCQLATLYLTASGSATLNPAAVNNGSSDNCGVPTLSVSPNTFGCADIGSNSVTLTVTDGSSNSSTCTAIVIVVDTIAPNAICQNTSATLGGGGTATITPAMIDNGSSDACGIDTMTVSPSVFACADVGPNTVTLTVTDVNGNSSTCTAIATINANDAVPPVAVCQDISLVMGAGSTVTINATALNNGSTDNCGIAGYSASPATLTCANLGNTTVTLTVTDGGGNTATCTSIVTLSDTTDPIAVCQNVNLPLDASGNATLTPALVDNGSTDNCGITSSVLNTTNFTCADIGPHPVTLTLTDASGNSSTCSATVTVQDVTAPTAVCQSVTLSLDAGGTASTTAAAVNNGSTDNCAIASVSLSTTSFTCANLGANSVTLTVTDAGGNAGTCTATITVQDLIAPVATCQNISVNLDASGNASTTAAAVNNGSTDNCAVASTSLSTSSFTCANLGPNSVTLTVTDASSNSSTCTATVTVVDALAPTAVCQNISVTLNAGGTATTTAAAVNNGSTDNCAIASLSLSQTSFTCANVGANNVTLTVTDASGNSSTCAAVVTVSDPVAPTALCQNVTVSLDASGNGSTTAAAVDNGSTDNCAIASMTLSTTSFTCANLGANNVTLTVTDAGGNSSTCTAVVTVTDAIAPTALCQNVTVSLDASGNGSTTAAAVNNGSTDNCAITSTSLSATSFTCADLGPNTVTLTVTDASGNSSTCTATVTVVDALAPTAVCQNVSVTLNAGGTASVTAAAVNNGSTDNCAIASTSLSTTSFTCANVGTNNVTLTVTDASGNSSTCTAVVTVTDPIAPTALCQNVTVSLDATGNAVTTAAAVNNGSTDNCAIASLSLSATSFTCANLGANTVTLTATDASGNSSTCTATVTVQDVLAPTALCQNVTVSLDASGNGSTTAAAVNNGSSDNCAIASTTLSTTSFTCANIGANTVTLTVTDASGNSSTCTAVVTVTDAIAPTALCQNVSVSLNAAGTATTTAAAVNNGSSDNCAIASTTLSTTSFTCANVGPNTVTLTVTDASGNTSTCTAVVTVTDAIAPTALCQNVSVSLDASGTATTTAAAVNNGSTDNCSIASTTLSTTSFTCANIGPNNVTLTVTDASGNSSTCTAVVTVTDALAPTALCQNVSVALNGSGTATVTAAAINNGSTDNCSIASVSVSPTSFTCANVGPNTVTLTVTDQSGNSSTCTAVVTVTESIAPNALCQNVSVSLDAAGTASTTAAAVDNGSTDNCAIASMTLSTTSFTCANIGPNTVTLTVTDAGGNVSTCTAVVTVTDALAPTALCQPVTVTLDASGNGSTTAAAVDNGSTDNCAIASVSLSQTAFTCANAGANTVTLTVTDASGNSSTCTATVTVIAPAVTGTVIADTTTCGYNVSCPGGNDGVAHASGSGGCPSYTYLWSSGGTNATETGLSAGVHHVTITDGAGNTYVDSVTITEPAAIQVASAVASTCFGDSTGSIDITVTGGNDCQGYTFLWSNGATSEDLANVPAGTYSVTITDVAGCTSVQSITVNSFAQLNPTFTDAGNVLTSNQTWTSYQWLLNGGPIAGANTISYTITQTGLYSLLVTDANGCSALTDTATVIFVGMADPGLAGLNLSIYPNPARSEFRLRTEAPIAYGVTVNITDMYGKRYVSQTMPELSTEVAFDLRAFAAGNYVVEVVTEMGQRKLFKLVVQ